MSTVTEILEAVKQLPDLSVPGLTVPAVPKAPEGDPTVIDGEIVEQEPAAA